jgi:hypothetical protein
MDADERDYMQIGDAGQHFVGKSHNKYFKFPKWHKSTNAK